MKCATCGREADEFDLKMAALHRHSPFEDWFCQKACWEAYEQKKEDLQ